MHWLWNICGVIGAVVLGGFAILSLIGLAGFLARR
jgi:hypothetical protein